MRLIKVIVALSFLLSVSVVQAQQDDTTNYFCNFDDLDSWDVEGIDQNTYTEACTLYVTCGDGLYYDVSNGCHVPAFELFLDACNDDDILTCQTRVALYTHALADGVLNGASSRQIIVNLRGIDGAFLEATQSFPLLGHESIQGYLREVREGYGITPTVYIALGTVFEFSEDLDSALEMYNNGVGYNDPLAHYLRGLLYGQLNDPTRASFDTLFLLRKAENNPRVVSLANQLNTQYPFDITTLEDWLVYDDYSYGSGPGGERLRDLSLTPPHSAQVGFYDEGEIILIIEEQLYSDDLVVIYERVGENTYVGGGSGRFNTFGMVNDVIFRQSASEGFESGGNSRTWLVRVGDPDPRPNYQRCENGARWRLTIGDITHPAQNPYYDIYYYDEPLGEQVNIASEFEVISEEPTCIDGVAWWEVQPTYPPEATDEIYWIQETIGTPEGGFDYTMSYPDARQFPCGTPLLSNLEHDLFAYVLPDIETLPLYAEADATSDVLATIPTLDTFQVITRASCPLPQTDDIIWWQVEYNGVIGFIQGSDGTRYFASIAQIQDN